MIRLVGVSMSNFTEPGTPGQLDLFESTNVKRRKALNRALDEIAARHGEEAFRRGDAKVERAAPTLAIKKKQP